MTWITRPIMWHFDLVIWDNKSSVVPTGLVWEYRTWIRNDATLWPDSDTSSLKKMYHLTSQLSKCWNNFTILEHWLRWPGLGCSVHTSQSTLNLCRQCRTCLAWCISFISSSTIGPDSWSSSWKLQKRGWKGPKCAPTFKMFFSNLQILKNFEKGSTSLRF